MISARKGLTLVSGPCKGGKSKWAESLLINQKNVLYVATSEIFEEDKRWEDRISIHRKRRPTNWNLAEVNSNLDNLIKQSESSQSILIDSIGGLVSSHINQPDKDWELIMDRFLSSLKNIDKVIVAVTEECGWGVVPTTVVGNLFRDRLGYISQELDLLSIDTWLVIQGRALNLKEISIKVS